MSLTERFSGCRQSKRPGGTPNRACTHSRADTDAIAQHNKAKRTLRACPRPWFASHAIPLPEEPILGCSRGLNRTIAVVPHTYATSGGFPGAIQQMPAARTHPLCEVQRACSLWAEQSAQIGRQRPLCARVASERLDARLPSECASFDGYFLRTRQAHTIMRAVPA